MTTRAFATWVEPVAADLHRERQVVAQYARGAPFDRWDAPSPLPGWSCKDIMSHLAAGTNKQLQAILRSVVSKTRLDPAIFGDDGVMNGRDVGERRDRPIAAIIAEYEADTEEILDLLSQVKDDDKDLKQKDFEMSFGDALPMYWRHDREHLDQLRTGLEGAS